jgi:hypothetical protein
VAQATFKSFTTCFRRSKSLHRSPEKFRRVNPNVKGTDDWTALEIAATNGILESVHLLLRCPAIKIYCWSPRGSSLHLAAQIPNGFKICQTLLLENPKLLTVKDQLNRTPIDLASSDNIRELFERYTQDLSKQKPDSVTLAYADGNGIDNIEEEECDSDDLETPDCSSRPLF